MIELRNVQAARQAIVMQDAQNDVQTVAAPFVLGAVKAGIRAGRAVVTRQSGIGDEYRTCPDDAVT